MATLREQVQDLMQKVPGYQGYAEKENRRAADKELRDAIAAAYSSQVTRITRLQERLINHGDFATTEVLDKVITRLQHLVDRIRHASYGYTPLFERTETLNETVLDRLYAFDLQMANGIDSMGGLINDLSENATPAATSDELLAKIDELHRTFDQRAHVINTFPAEGTGSTSAQHMSSMPEAGSNFDTTSMSEAGGAFDTTSVPETSRASETSSTLPETSSDSDTPPPFIEKPREA